MTKRRKPSDLREWLGRSATALFVLDSERRVAVFNAGCEGLTGWNADEVLGTVGHYGSVSTLSGATALAASLCPPPEVFAGNEAVAPAYVVHKDGRALSRLLHFFPIRDGAGRISGVLGIILPMPAPGPALDVSPARRLHAELAAARSSLRARFGPSSLVAEGLTMRKVMAQVALAQQSAVPVLLLGESGVGKEHLARAIHLGSAHREQLFVPLDCRRLGPDEFSRIWTRLFETPRAIDAGEAGSFPGTVYLSDIESLPRDVQERLVAEFSVDGPRGAPRLRLLTSTADDPKDAVAKQKLRTDFFAFVSPLTIAIPPLRERGNDIPLLAQHLLEDLNRQQPTQLAGFDEAVWPLFRRYQWPGNLDELTAVVREAREHASETLIRVADLPYRFRTALEAQALPPPAEVLPVSLDGLLTKVETRLIALALERFKNNKSKAAEFLGVHRARLIRRIEQLGLGDAAATDGQEPLADLSAELMQDEP